MSIQHFRVFRYFRVFRVFHSFFDSSSRKVIIFMIEKDCEVS